LGALLREHRMTVRKLLGGGLAGATLVAIGVWIGGRHAAEPVVAAAPAPAIARPMPRAARLPALPDRAAITAGLAADLRDADAHVRRAAIAELATSDAPDPKALLAASHDANLDVALAATESLGALYRAGEISAQDMIARATDRGAPAKVRITALSGLGLVASREAAATLVDLLAHGDPIERRSAAILLVHQDPATAVPALIGALADPDDVVRSNAHDSLRALAHGRDLGDDAGAWARWWQTRTI
jgi:HEAT repeat protein